MIRDEVNQLSDKVAELGKTLCDSVPNKDQAMELVNDIFGIVTEGVDFGKIPSSERAKAIAHAFIKAGDKIADVAIKYSDDTPKA